jgi:AraC family transcriptional regulator
MEWSERLNSAIDYIEDNLTGEIITEIAADKALCSSFHFQRIFYVVTGVTMGEYIRRRRLTLAATELSSGNPRVIDVALKYGYDSPGAFARAFRNMHGVTPQAAREPGVALVAYPRVSFHIRLEGGFNMDYKITEKPAFDVVGKARRFTTANGENFVKIPQFWTEFAESKDGQVLFGLNGGKPGPVTGADNLGVCFDYEGMDEFSYGIAVEKIGDTVPTGFEVIHIPASTWAIFDIIGAMPHAIGDANKRIFGEWLPSSGYEHTGTADFEAYFPGDVNSPDYHTQVWVPVKKK